MPGRTRSVPATFCYNERMKILVGTTNHGKFSEIAGALSAASFSAISPESLNIFEEPAEDHDTLHDNALHKARFYFQRSDLPTLADDSGLFVEALKDELGVKTRRWGAGKDVSDREWVDFFLGRMRDEKNKNAHFHSVIAYIDSEGDQRFFEGICRGTITEELESDFPKGLPLLACFKPEGFDKVFALLSVEEKASINHRSLAMQQFIRHITL